MDADSVLAALSAMAGDTVPKTKSKAQKLAEVVTPEPKMVKIAESTTPDNQRDDATPGLVPVVVLDDGSTFSDIGGARIVLVPHGADTLPDGAYDNGIPIKGLVDLYNAIRGIVR